MDVGGGSGVTRYALGCGAQRAADCVREGEEAALLKWPTGFSGHPALTFLSSGLPALTFDVCLADDCMQLVETITPDHAGDHACGDHACVFGFRV